MLLRFMGYPGSTAELHYPVRLTSNALDRFRKMEMLHKAQNMLLEPLNCFTFNDHSTTLRESKTTICSFFAVSRFCDIPEPEWSSCIHQGTKEQKSYLKCRVLLIGSQDLGSCSARTDIKTNKVQNCVRDIISLHKGLQHLEYPGGEAAVKTKSKCQWSNRVLLHENIF